MATKEILSDPKQLIPFLNRKLYEKGDSYSPGTGFCIKKDYKVYLAPAEINPDLLDSEDIYTFNEMLDENGNPDIDKAPINESLTTSKYSKIYLHLLEEFSCNCVLLVESQSIKIAADLYSDSLVFSNNECLTNITNTLTKERLKCNDSLKIPIIPNKQPQDELISDLINALYSNSPTCGCIIKGFGLILLGESWMSVRNMFETVKQFIQFELNSLQYRIRNDITQQISQINHRIDNLTKQINNKKQSISSSTVIEKLKSDENKESNSSNTLPIVEDSALLEDKVFISKEDGQEDKYIEEHCQDIEMKEPLQHQIEFEDNNIKASTDIEENHDEEGIIETNKIGINEKESIEEDTNIEEIEKSDGEVADEKEADLGSDNSDSEDTDELEAELEILKKLKTSSEVPIEIESDKEETIEIESDSEEANDKSADPTETTTGEANDKSADPTDTTTGEANDKSADPTDTTTREANDKSSATSQDNVLDSDIKNIEDKVDGQNNKDVEASSNCDIINEEVNKDESESNASEEPVVKVTRRSSRRSAPILLKANAKPSTRKSKKPSPSKSNIQSENFIETSSLSTTINTSSELTSVSSVEDSSLTKSAISSKSPQNSSLPDTNETTETVDASFKNTSANGKDKLQEVASTNMPKVPIRSSTRSASKSSKPKVNTSKSILLENDQGIPENVNEAVDETNKTTKDQTKKTTTAEPESVKATSTQSKSEKTTITQSESNKDTASKDETKMSISKDAQSKKTEAEPKNTAKAKINDTTPVNAEAEKATACETKKTQAKTNETRKEDEGELDIELTLSSMEHDELFEGFEEEPDYEAEENSDDEKPVNDANDKSGNNDDDDDCCIILDDDSPTNSTKSPQEKRKRPVHAESKKIKRQKGENPNQTKKRTLEELSALVMPRPSPINAAIAKAAAKNPSAITQVAPSSTTTMCGKLTASNIRKAMYTKSFQPPVAKALKKANDKALENKNFTSGGSLGAWQGSSTTSEKSGEFEKSQQIWNKSMLEALKIRNEVPAQTLSKEDEEKVKIEATAAAAIKYAQDLARRAKSAPKTVASKGRKPPSGPVMVTSATKEAFRYSPGKSSNRYFPAPVQAAVMQHDRGRSLPSTIQHDRGMSLPTPVRSTNTPSNRYDGQSYNSYGSNNMPNMMAFSGSNMPSNMPNMTSSNNYSNQDHDDQMRHLSNEERQLWFKRQEIIREKKILMQEMGISEDEMRNFNF